VEAFIDSPSREVLLLKVLGLTVLVAGIAQQLQISAAVGAFLVGIALSGPLAHTARELLSPLRDLFAAVFFVFFGLRPTQPTHPRSPALRSPSPRRELPPSTPPVGSPPAAPGSGVRGERARARRSSLAANSTSSLPASPSPPARTPASVPWPLSSCQTTRPGRSRCRAWWFRA